MNRRYFLAALSAVSARRAVAAGDKLTIACMGVRGRAGHLLRGFLDLPDVEVAMLCDIDSRLLPAAAKLVQDKKGKAPRTTGDFRRALDDKSIDALVVGTPDHWHALPTILACQAGKHVYVEKPCSHNVREGQVMLAAARKHNRVVQVGIQSRSGRHFAEACEYIRSGALGKVVLARGWEASRQRSTGRPADTAVPAGVDYDLWLGPAPKRPFNPNRFHYNWHWFWDYGNGDIGNQGVHEMDICRWGLNLNTLPRRVVSTGGKFVYQDDQETPNTQSATFDYGGVQIQFEVRGLLSHPDGALEFRGNNTIGNTFYGADGFLSIDANGYQIFKGEKHELVKEVKLTENIWDTRPHFNNFIAAVRSRRHEDLTCDIEQGHLSAALCHLANISYRTGRSLRFDSAKETFVNDADANKLLTREYRTPFTLPDPA